MLSIDRKKEILKLLMDEESVKVSELASRFEVDMSTVRRDLKALSDQYNIEIFYGGASFRNALPTQSIIEENLKTKKTKNLRNKQIIAQKAAKLVVEGDTIILSSGSTAELVLDYLEGFNSINVITQSLDIAVKATAKPFIDLYMIGGKYREFSGMFYSEFSTDLIKKFSANKVFMGSTSISLSHGFTHQIMEEASNLKALIQISQERYLIADSRKFGKVSLAQIADLTDFNAFIVDDEFPDIYKQYAELHNIDII